MKIQKLAITVLFAGGMIAASASMASAADEKPQISIDCAQGFEAVYSDDGSSGNCEAIATTFDATTDGSCWTTADGADVCARGVDVGEPRVLNDCVEHTLDDGSQVCINDLVAYSTPPQDTPVSQSDCLTETAPCEDIVPISLTDESLMFKNYSAAGSSSNSDSNTLAALGVLVAALGAFGIGLSNQRASKK